MAQVFSSIAFVSIFIFSQSAHSAIPSRSIYSIETAVPAPLTSLLKPINVCSVEGQRIAKSRHLTSELSSRQRYVCLDGNKKMFFDQILVTDPDFVTKLLNPSGIETITLAENAINEEN